MLHSVHKSTRNNTSPPYALFSLIAPSEKIKESETVSISYEAHRYTPGAPAAIYQRGTRDAALKCADRRARARAKKSTGVSRARRRGVRRRNGVYIREEKSRWEPNVLANVSSWGPGNLLIYAGGKSLKGTARESHCRKSTSATYFFFSLSLGLYSLDKMPPVVGTPPRALIR